MEAKVRLKIAEVVIEFQSDFEPEKFTPEDVEYQAAERFSNYFYEGGETADILIRVEVVDRLPRIVKTAPVFVSYHLEDQSENWQLVKKGSTYIFKCLLIDKRQIMLVNEDFNQVTAYLRPKKDKGFVWNVMDITYDFLQVLLINYLAQRSEGIFTHSVGIKEENGDGLLFNGKSGAGKSTTARLWQEHASATVLNDDRVIVRKDNGKYFIHNSPWHGDFGDHLASKTETAPLENLFFIYHAPENTVRQLPEKEAFSLLYPTIFPTFWDKACLENTISFAHDLIQNVPCYNLGFVNNKDIIEFVRNI